MKIKTQQNQSQNKVFWNFSNNPQNEEEIVLRISGEIISDDYAWIYEWFGIPVASPNAFRKELAKYKGKDITVWIDSYGGDVFAAAGIYNALKEHDGKVITVVDGKAMSAASVIAMAGEEIQMSPVGIMMIHNPWSSAQGDAREMRHAADVLDEVKETIVNAYQLKTGKSRKKISEMMDNESFMSAKAALKEGFADKILYTEGEVNPQLIEDSFIFSHLSIQNSMNDTMKKFFEIAQKEGLTSSAKQDSSESLEPDANIKNNKQEVTTEMEIKNSAEFKTQLPAIHDEVFNSGIAAEKARLKAFDVLNGKVDPEFLAKEKYEDGATAESVLFKAMQEGKLIDASYVSNAAKDASTANTVEGDASDNSAPDEVTGVLNLVKNVAEKTIGKLKGGNR